MKFKVFKIAATLVAGSLIVTGVACAQESAKPSVLSECAETDVKVSTECKAVTTCALSSKPGKLKVNTLPPAPPTPPTRYLVVSAAAERAAARVEQHKAEANEHLQQRLPRKRTPDPDSPTNAELTEIPAVAFGYREQPPFEGKLPETQEAPIFVQHKEYSKIYSIDANDKLVINNIFGDVTVHTWNRNEFKVDVDVKVAANEGEVLISDTKTNSMVSFTTKITQRNRNIFSRGTNNIIVNYTVYMPAKNALEIRNKFGTINLPDMEGRVVINSEYGGLNAKTLSSTGNIINVSYGNARIESLRESDLNSEYGTLVLLSADKLNANIRDCSAKIGRIVYSGTINTKYGGSLLIGHVSKNLRTLTINSDYTNVKLGVNNSENANFDVTIRNGNFDYDKKANIYVASQDSNDNKKRWATVQNFKGTVGKGSPSKVIFVNSSYSTVKFD